MIFTYIVRLCFYKRGFIVQINLGSIVPEFAGAAFNFPARSPVRYSDLMKKHGFIDAVDSTPFFLLNPIAESKIRTQK